MNEKQFVESNVYSISDRFAAIKHKSGGDKDPAGSPPADDKDDIDDLIVTGKKEDRGSGPYIPVHRFSREIASVVIFYDNARRNISRLLLDARPPKSDFAKYRPRELGKSVAGLRANAEALSRRIQKYQRGSEVNEYGQ